MALAEDLDDFPGVSCVGQAFRAVRYAVDEMGDLHFERLFEFDFWKKDFTGAVVE